MTDNEKRAHDLAIVSLPILLEISNRDAFINEESVVSFDAYSEYLKVYSKTLELFKRDFPDTK